MRLARLGPAGAEIPVVTLDGAHLDLRPVTTDLDGDFFARGGLDLRAGGVVALQTYAGPGRAAGVPPVRAHRRPPCGRRHAGLPGNLLVQG